jgi:hypothetical protein
VGGRTVAHTKDIVNNMLVHEYNFVSSTVNEMKYFHCTTCGTFYCQLYGKSVDASATQNHRIDNSGYKQIMCTIES